MKTNTETVIMDSYIAWEFDNIIKVLENNFSDTKATWRINWECLEVLFPNWDSSSKLWDEKKEIIKAIEAVMPELYCLHRY